MSIDISVVIPTYNRLNGLKNCLESNFTQDYPKDNYEIIVVDDGEDEIVKKMLAELQKEHSNLRFLSQKHRGPAAARNRGVKTAQGQIIAFIDDDCRVSAGWLKAMSESHRKNPEITAIGGLTVSSTKRSPVLVSQFLSNCSIETCVNGKRQVIFFPTCNVSLKRRIFDTHAFNETFPLPGGEDLEFFWRSFKDGYRFIWDKEIEVIHYRDESTIGFLKQASIYGRGNLQVKHIHQDQPLLKELKTGKISFWLATLINIIKIPRFSYLLGRRLIQESKITQVHKKASIYAYFTLHKIFYLVGNIAEFPRIRIKKLREIKAGYHVPRLLIMDITHACNLACRICDIWKTAEAEKNIGISHIRKLLSQAAELMIPEIALSGGEPLLRKDIFDIFDYARKLGIKNLGVLTNGILIGEHLQRLLPYLTDETISLVISLDSLKQDVHNQIRNSPFAWQKTMESLKKLSALKKWSPRINFNIITIILDQNLEELLELADFVKSLGADSLQFQPLLSNNLSMAERKRSAFWVPEQRMSVLDECMDRLIEFKEYNPRFIKNSIANLLLVKKYYRGTLASHEVRCASASETVLTSNQGTCTTCFSCYGSIRDADLKEILAGAARVKAREKVRGCAWPCLLPCFCD